MYRKKQRTIVWLVTVCFLLLQIVISSPLYAQEMNPGTDRIAGADRYKTAVAISQLGWGTSDYAVLARGDDFADALCAGPLAFQYDGPILLTPPQKLNMDTLNELKRLGVKHVFIVGGSGAISQDVEDALQAEGIETIERISGADRYETSVKIAEKIKDTNGDSNSVVLATGSDFPDALSVSGIAANLGMPILLSDQDSLPSSVSNYLQANADTITTTYIVGGTGVISESVTDRVPNPTRLAGADRYETNKEVLQNFVSELNFERIYIATGMGFADALTGAVLAAKSASPLVLTGEALALSTAEYIQNNLTLTAKILGLGGESVVPSSILNRLVSAKELIPVEEKYSTAGTYGPETGTQTIEGSVIISSADVILQNTIIEGDLLLGRSIGDGNVELRDITVKGKTIVNGGGPNSIIMYNFNGQTIRVNVPDGSNVRLVAQGNTSVANVSMESKGTLEESGLTRTGFVTVTIPVGAEVTLNGSITTLNISNSAIGTRINLESETSISTLNVNAPATIIGAGQINRANINTDGVSIEQTPATTIIAEGFTAMIGGQVRTGITTPSDSGGGPSTIKVSGITVTGADGSSEVAKGESLQMNAEIMPAEATYKTVTWSVEAGTGSATIDDDGLLTATDGGTVSVKASATDNSGTSGECEITIVYSYSYGSLTGKLYPDGKLIISGTGDMPDYNTSYNRPPHYEQSTLIREVVIEDGVSRIGTSMFDNCTELTSVSIGCDVTYIGTRAFKGCTQLTGVIVPDNVITLGSYVFEASGLTSLSLGSGLESMSDSSLRGCTGLSSIDVAEENNHYSSIDGVLLDKSKSTLITYPQGKTGLYEIPDEVRTIKTKAFESCTGLSELQIHDSVTSIEAQAFYNCTGLQSVSIGTGIAVINRSAFSSCGNLSEVNIGENVTSIGDFAFVNCTSLESITIPDSVVSIGQLAFADCTSLSTVFIGSGFENYSIYTFSNCTNLASFTVSDENVNFSSNDGILFDKEQSTLFAYPLARSGEYIIPDTVTTIAGRAFRNCTGLTSLTLLLRYVPNWLA